MFGFRVVLNVFDVQGLHHLLVVRQHRVEASYAGMMFGNRSAHLFVLPSRFGSFFFILKSYFDTSTGKPTIDQRPALLGEPQNNILNRPPIPQHAPAQFVQDHREASFNAAVSFPPRPDAFADPYLQHPPASDP